MRKRSGLTLVEVLVAGAILVFVVMLAIVANLGAFKAKIKKTKRMICGANLNGMNRGFSIYAHDNDGKYPFQGGGDQVWGRETTDWDKPAKKFDTAGKVTISSSLYLLVREADIEVKSFVCRESGDTVFVNETEHGMTDIWDFGANPSKHQSYAYQIPFGKFASGESTKPGNAILGDRNPWFDEKLTVSSIDKETVETFSEKISLIDLLEGAERWKSKIGNSSSHERDGQNVLFGDGHVEFCDRGDVGSGGDNIYTIGGDTEEDRRRGTSPTGTLLDAANTEDSLLVNDM